MSVRFADADEVQNDRLKEERKLKTRERELTIEDAVSEAHGELVSLGEEMREAYDNTPESLQQSGVGEARGEAADTLENIDEPEVPTELQGDKFTVKWTVRALTPKQQDKLSRSARRDEAITTLQAVIDRLQEIAADETGHTEEEREAAGAFVDDVQNAHDEAEGVEFPGMYG